MTGSDQDRGLRTEADVDARVVVPYLAALGIQPNQIQAQRTFSVRLGRANHVVNGREAASGRLDYLVTNDDGRPLFVVELKGPEESLRLDGRGQALSYARLVHPMALLVVVTNGKDTALYDTITGEALSDPNAAHLIRGGGTLTDDESLLARAEALEHFLGYSAGNVAAFARAQLGIRMATLRSPAGRHTGKYDADLYIPRAAIRQRVSAFLRASPSVFALVGPSGYGKTNEMCSIAEELAGTHITLFYAGADIVTSLREAIVSDFSWHFSEALSLPQLIRRLDRIACRTGRTVVLVVDAIDEATNLELAREAGEFAQALSQFDGRIRLLVSAKPTEWRRFVRVRGNPSMLAAHIYAPTVANGRSTGNRPDDVANEDGDLTISLSIGPFTPAERDLAIGRYAATLGISGDWPYSLRELACDPFMLRMIAEEAANSGIVPSRAGERELIRRYLRHKAERTSDPARAQREVIVIAQALSNASSAPYDDVSGVMGASISWVCEAEINRVAGLPLTAAFAEELIAFGVLLRSVDGDGNGRIGFAYDRVRNYAIAMYGLQLPNLDATEFSRVVDAYLGQPVNANAIRWYLPYATESQWAAFIQSASRRVDRLLRTYEALRAELKQPVWERVEPRTRGDVGALFGVTRAGYSALALFRRERPDLPRVVFDPEAVNFGRDNVSEGRIPVRLHGTRRGSSGFWFLAEPEQYAATLFLEELRRLPKEAGLVEDDDYLLRERVAALVSAYASELKIPRWRPRVPRFADHFIARELFPLDLGVVSQAVQTALAMQSYQDARIEARSQEVIAEYRARGEVPHIISVSVTTTAADEQAARERATRELASGRDFTEATRRAPEFTLLARSVNSLLRHTEWLDQPLLPAPDVAETDGFRGAHNFEDGYTDYQLARLLETIFDAASRAYDHVLRASFTDRLIELLDPIAVVTGVVVHRRTHDEEGRIATQFSAGVTYGKAAQRDGTPIRRRAVGIAVTDGAATAEMDTTHWFEPATVRIEQRTFFIEWQTSTTLASLIAPSDAPPFWSNGPSSPARMAPVRARVYDLLDDALCALSVHRILSLVEWSADA